jgi:uncharacterized protein YndB with AHSA1/START domain
MSESNKNAPHAEHTASPSESIASVKGDREITITRVFGASPERVFEAFTRAEQIGRWWGPIGFTTTTTRMDVRVGGTWHFTMHGPDGRDFPGVVTYVEVVPGKRLVYHHAAGEGTKDSPEPLGHTTTATFEEIAPGRTRMVYTMAFASAGARGYVIKSYGALEGCTQTIGRLAEYVEAAGSAAAGVDPFVISRVFNAPQRRMFEVWTEQDHLVRWFGPKGFTTAVAKMDFRIGGTFHYCMRSPEGHEMWGKAVYREIDPPRRVVWVTSFSDASGGFTRHPASATWPLEMLTTVTFEPAGSGTKVTVRWEPINATAEEIKTFDRARESMTQGWSGSFAQLDEYVA